MNTDLLLLGGATVSACVVGCLLGYLVGLREGIRRGRPTWDEKNRAAVRAWQDGVAFGQHLERCKAELGL
jgi:hypothetical protein